MHTDSMETVSCFPYGVVAGVMRVKMREFWPCMLMHLLWSAAWGLLRAGRREPTDFSRAVCPARLVADDHRRRNRRRSSRLVPGRRTSPSRVWTRSAGGRASLIDAHAKMAALEVAVRVVDNRVAQAEARSSRGASGCQENGGLPGGQSKRRPQGHRECAARFR